MSFLKICLHYLCISMYYPCQHTQKLRQDRQHCELMMMLMYSRKLAALWPRQKTHEYAHF